MFGCLFGHKYLKDDASKYRITTHSKLRMHSSNAVYTLETLMNSETCQKCKKVNYEYSITSLGALTFTNIQTKVREMGLKQSEIVYVDNTERSVANLQMEVFLESLDE